MVLPNPIIYSELICHRKGMARRTLDSANAGLKRAGSKLKSLWGGMKALGARAKKKMLKKMSDVTAGTLTPQFSNNFGIFAADGGS